MGYTILTGIWEEIDDELHRQRQKHGDRCMEERNTYDAVPPLGEEFGEVAQAATQWKDESKPLAKVRHELIQLAACCIAMIRHVDRLRWYVTEGAPAVNDDQRRPVWWVTDRETGKRLVGDGNFDRAVAERQAAIYNAQGGPYVD